MKINVDETCAYYTSNVDLLFLPNEFSKIRCMYKNNYTNTKSIHPFKEFTLQLIGWEMMPTTKMNTYFRCKPVSSVRTIVVTMSVIFDPLFLCNDKDLFISNNHKNN